MKEASEVTPFAISPAPAGRILIVDDDPVVTGMLGVTLAAAGHEIIEVNSGEDALARLGSQSREWLPDIIILDIEMEGGIDGYETCRRLRSGNATRELPVIFLSGHDGLDDRLQAYDAGGDDFMAKPFDPAEILRKATLAIRHKRRQVAAIVEGKSPSDTAMIALGEADVTLKFSRGALGCRSLHALAALTLDSMSAFGVDCQVQLRTPTETLTLTPHGPASPLEESVLEKLRTMDRIFSFKNRMIINCESVSLLVTNMPINNVDLCGCIRDDAAMIADSAVLAVENINLRNESVIRTDELRELAKACRQAVEQLRDSYRTQEEASRSELENMASTVEDMYIHLGLTNMQELSISDSVRGAVDRVLTLFENAHELDQAFAGIVDDLAKAGDYTVAQNDEPMLMVELW